MNRRTFLFGCAAAAAAQVPPEHPRLYFRPSDLDMLRGRLTHPRLARPVQRLRAAANADPAGASTERAAEIARSRALLAVLDNNAALGRSAVAIMVSRLPQASWD